MYVLTWLFFGLVAGMIMAGQTGRWRTFIHEPRTAYHELSYDDFWRVLALLLALLPAYVESERFFSKSLLLFS